MVQQAGEVSPTGLVTVIQKQASTIFGSLTKFPTVLSRVKLAIRDKLVKFVEGVSALITKVFRGFLSSSSSTHSTLIAEQRVL